jgi:hypothetical protein
MARRPGRIRQGDPPAERGDEVVRAISGGTLRKCETRSPTWRVAARGERAIDAGGRAGALRHHDVLELGARRGR